MKTRYDTTPPPPPAKALQDLAMSYDKYAIEDTRPDLARDAGKLRLVAALTMNRTYTHEYAWTWADAAAGYLHRYQTELRRK